MAKAGQVRVREPRVVEQHREHRRHEHGVRTRPNVGHFNNFSPRPASDTIWRRELVRGHRHIRTVQLRELGGWRPLALAGANPPAQAAAACWNMPGHALGP